MSEAATQRSSVPQEITGIIFLGFGSLLFLALISFEPNDLGFFQEEKLDPASNFIGPVGAFFAGWLVILIGLASFALPVIFVFGGLGLMMGPKVRYGLKLIWFSLLVLSCACLMQLAEPLLGSVILDYGKSEWPGGYIGWKVNDQLLVTNLGTAGAIIVMGILNIISLVLLFDIRPIEMARKIRQLYNDLVDAYEQSKLEGADELERLAYEQRKLAEQEAALRQRLKTEGGFENTLEVYEALERREEEKEKEQRGGARVKKPRKKKVKDPEEAAEPVAAVDPEPSESVEPIAPVEPPREYPEPKVIDTTQELEASQEPEPEQISGIIDRRPRKNPRSSKTKDDGKNEMLEPITQISAPVTDEAYQLPAMQLLAPREKDANGGASVSEMEENRTLLVETMKQFGIEVTPGDITRGATVTRYEVYPAAGVRVERIANLEKNLARALKAERINILAPIPGKDTVGIDVGNRNKTKVVLRELFESDKFRKSKGKIPIAIGKDVYGGVLVTDLADMPHLLIAGSTGSGKSVCINCILLSLLYKFGPEDLRLILVDPKVVELQVYNNLPHLVVPVVTDPKKVLIALRWVINEMEKRYRMLAKAGVRNISAFNARPPKPKSEPQEVPEGAEGDDDFALPGMEEPKQEDDLPDKLPYVVVIIDELADLMQTAAADVELAIARLSAKARAAGIHLIIATQTPRASVITGVIKTNVPARIAFQVPSGLDSRVILDENGAENLLGKGDLLYLPPASSKLVRAQGAFVSDDEVESVVSSLRVDGEPAFESEIHEKLNRGGGEESDISEKDEELIGKCIEVIKQEKRASTSLLQRRLRIGYARASWVVDYLEQQGVLGPKDGAKDREILVDLDQL